MQPTTCSIDNIDDDMNIKNCPVCESTIITDIDKATMTDSEIINKVGVSVSKKHFKNAVDRNKIKRLLRVATKSHFHKLLEPLDSKYCLMVLYVGKEMPRSKELDVQFTSMTKRFNKKILNEVKL